MDSLDTIKTQAKGILEALDDLVQRNELMTEMVRSAKEKMEEAKKLLVAEQEEHKNTKANLDAVKRENYGLKTQIEILEDERQQFMRVSHVIALEKETAKLRAENEKLKEAMNAKMADAERIDAKLAAVKTDVKPAERIDRKLEAEPVVKPDPEPAELDEDAEEFVEKKIKGVVYYIGQKTQYIYAKTEDDEVGDKLGMISKDANGRSKVLWD